MCELHHTSIVNTHTADRGFIAGSARVVSVLLDTGLLVRCLDGAELYGVGGDLVDAADSA
jgi:hypothetical protein